MARRKPKYYLPGLTKDGRAKTVWAKASIWQSKKNERDAGKPGSGTTLQG